MKAGDKVVCIETDSFRVTIKGEIYTVKESSMFGGRLVITLKEVDPPLEYDCFYTDRFRLVDYEYGRIIGEYIEKEINKEIEELKRS